MGRFPSDKWLSYNRLSHYFASRLHFSPEFLSSDKVQTSPRRRVIIDFLELFAARAGGREAVQFIVG